MIINETLSSHFVDATTFSNWLKNPSPIREGQVLFILDAYCVKRENELFAEIVFPPHIHAEKMTEGVRLLSENDDKLQAQLIPFARGYLLRSRLTKKPTDLILNLPEGNITIPISSSDLSRFHGKNSAYLFSQDDQSEVVAQWINFHENEQNLESVCLVRAKDWKVDDVDFQCSLKKYLVESNVEILIVETDAPLGGDAPPMSSLWEAPDAPGKDRMDKPERDFWRSAPSSAQMLEIMRWRFLNEAKAVLNATPTDLYVRRTKYDLFESCAKSNDGYFQLYGERVYPWRVRNDDRVSFGDHCVHRFDGASRNKSWIVNPNGPRKKWQWNLFRIGPAIEDNEPSLRFWRFMGLRHIDPHNNNPTLAPKTALVIYPELIDFLQREFDAKPVLPPEVEAAPKLAPASKSGRRCIVTTMKNEGPFLLEWIAFHRAIGFDDFVVYTNDCDDGTDDLLDLLQERGMVERYDNPFKTTGLRPQHAALFDAQEKATVQNADWLICMDCDEFIDIKVGDGTLDALFHAVGNANFISLTWRLFGNGGVVEYEDRPIIEQFTSCANEVARFPHQAWGVKTLYRNLDFFKKMGVHRPKGLKPEYRDHIHWVNGSGKALPEKFIRNGWRTGLASYGYDLVQLNHYALRSMESFLVKRDRGRVNHVERDQGLIYWFRMNHNPNKDTSIQRMLPKFREEYDKLLSDPVILAQHEACVRAHREKIEELKSRPDYKAFFDEINSERLRKLSHYVPYFGMNVFLIGPEAVNEDIIAEIDQGKRKYFNPPASLVKGDGHH